MRTASNVSYVPLRTTYQHKAHPPYLPIPFICGGGGWMVDDSKAASVCIHARTRAHTSANVLSHHCTCRQADNEKGGDGLPSAPRERERERGREREGERQTCGTPFHMKGKREGATLPYLSTYSYPLSPLPSYLSTPVKPLRKGWRNVDAAPARDVDAAPAAPAPAPAASGGSWRSGCRRPSRRS
mmetsp:Transcript_30597/g.88981  ORF Transcript_30597/g.88981 Transcript_30597/m.88981 type:complete len:185 (+) Transcript_30597:1013-1567(+)